MRSPTMLVSVLLISGLSADPVRAQQFQWSSPFWQPAYTGGTYSHSYTDTPNGGTFSGSGQHGFYQSGQFGGSNYATTTYTRPFSVSGSAAGWQLAFLEYAQGYTQGLHGIGNASFAGKIDGNIVFNYSYSNGGGGLQFPFFWGSPFGQFPVVADGAHMLEISHTLGGYTPGPPYSFPGSFGAGTINNYEISMTATPVPEPALLGALLALAGLAVRRR